MAGFTALIISDSTAETPDAVRPVGVNDLAAIRSAPGVKSARRYHLSDPQRFPGPWPHLFTVVELDGEAGAKAWTAHRKDAPAVYKNSRVGVFESMRARFGEPPKDDITHMMIAMSTPKPGKENDDEFNRWYWERHFPDGMRLPGMISGERFKGHPDLSSSDFPYEYMALYDLRIKDLMVHITETNRVSRTPEMPLTDALHSGYAWYVVPTKE